VSARRAIVWGVAVAALAALLAVGLSGRGASTARSAPPLPRAALAGQPLTLAALLSSAPAGTAHASARHGAIVLFWASWCAPCQREAPAVERFARSAAGRGRIVAVDYGESEMAAARAFVRRYAWSFPVLRDPDARAGEAYGLVNLPSTFVVDSAGRIRAVMRGPQTVASLTHALAAVERS
jgi:thiol-disulfide isomerase/thioredoxin